MVNYNVIFKCIFLGVISVSCSQNQPEHQEKLINETSTVSEDFSELDTWQVNQSTIQGRTQGTTFIIKTSDDSLVVSADEVDSTLKEFDSELSGYIASSLLSRLNASSDTFYFPKNDHFLKCFNLSYSIFEKTNGAFDPSVFPLVRAWGFFKDVKNPPSDEQIDSILAFTSFEKGKHYELTDAYFIKKDERFQIDFNAIAQGQSADVLGEVLTIRGQTNYFIEVGGEIAVKGVNNEGKPWVIGIDMPEEDNYGWQPNRKLENYLSILDKGIATSGNYRKFYEDGGKKYSHSLNPKTGRPVTHNLLSATVVAENAALADGYATAFMVMGVDKTMQFLEENKDLSIGVYLLFENDQGRLERAYNEEMKRYFL